MDINDLFKEMEETKVSREVSNVTKGKTKKLYFPPNEDDGELLVKIKEIINDKDLYYADVYDKYGKQLGINMINGLKKGQISWARFKMWLDLLEYDYDLTLTPRNK